MNDGQIDIAERNLDRILTWIGRLDTRAAFIFSVNVILLSAIAHFIPESDWKNLGLGLGLLSSGLQGISLIYIAGCIFPRLNAPQQSLFYFGTIKDRSPTNFISGFKAATPEDLLNDILLQCHKNAEIAAKKSNLLKRAYQFLFLSLTPWLAAILILSNGTGGGA